MDIISRLKSFMDSLQIGNSQFADNCRIPRPTLSQMLNGRNKKISDEIIAKIHTAYPQLSVLWLMFGEGNMLTNANTSISEPQKAPNSPQISFFENDTQRFTTLTGQPQNKIDLEPENNSATKSDSGQQKKQNYSEETAKLPLSLDPDQLTAVNSNSPKKIANIVVFYTDNSFQSFTPSEL